MYNINRTEASEMLNISTRSLDRHIKAWKIRAKKSWKTVFINSEDIKIILWWNQNTSEIIVPEVESLEDKNLSTKNEPSKSIIKKSEYDKISATFEKVFSSLREDINTKDDKIQDLSIRLGRAEEVASSSISLSEHKKSQFLIEESKNHLNREITDMMNNRNEISEELKYEKTTNKLLIWFVIILLIAVVIIWFMQI